MDDRKLLIRVLLAFLAIGPLVTGMWAVSSPAHWYENFPGLGRSWIPPEGPFNRHLIVDAGAGFLAVGVLALIAFVWARREVIQVAMAAYLFHVVPHFVYHLTHPVSELSTSDLVLGIGGLGLQMALAVVALIAVGIRPPAQPARERVAAETVTT